MTVKEGLVPQGPPARAARGKYGTSIPACEWGGGDGSHGEELPRKPTKRILPETARPHEQECLYYQFHRTKSRGRLIPAPGTKPRAMTRALPRIHADVTPDAAEEAGGGPPERLL